MTQSPIDSSDQQLMQRSRQALDRTIEEMDAATLSRLNRIRHEALSQANNTTHRGWLMAGALATACVLVIATGLALRGPTTTPEPIEVAVESPLDDLDLLSSNEDLEMLADLEFYAWLETELEG